MHQSPEQVWEQKLWLQIELPEGTAGWIQSRNPRQPVSQTIWFLQQLLQIYNSGYACVKDTNFIMLLWYKQPMITMTKTKLHIWYDNLPEINV